MKNISFYKLYLVLGFIITLFGLFCGLALEDFSSLYIKIHIFIGLLLLLIGLVIAVIKTLSRKESFGLFKYVRKSILLILLILLLGFVNYFTARSSINWDLTEQKIYSLSEESKKIVKQVVKPFTFFVVDSKNSNDREHIKQLFGLYSNENPKITFEFVSVQNARSVRDYINPSNVNMFYMEYGQGEDKIVGTLGKFEEIEISQAINKITATNSKVVYYLTGHGEPDIQSESELGLKSFGDTVSNLSYNLVGLLLSSVKKVPEDASLLILASTEKDYLDSEKKLLKDYILQGGKVLILGDPKSKDDFSFLLSDIGIKINSNIVLDQLHILHGASEIGWQIIASEFSNHQITNGFSASKSPVVFLLASSVGVDRNVDKEKYVNLLSSSKASWGETNFTDLFQKDPKAEFNKEEDLKGPLSLGVAYNSESSNPIYGKNSRVVVYGDIEWARNANLNIYSNKELLVNTVNWLIEDNTNSWVKKTIRPSRLNPIKRSTFQIMLIMAFLLPEIILIGLLSIWFYRNNRND